MSERVRDFDNGVCPSVCKGHRRWIGGRLDGLIEHMCLVHPSDFPEEVAYPAGARYERTSFDGTEAVYRLQAKETP